MPRRKPYAYGSDWRAVRAAVLERDERRCYECGRPADQVDHIVPVLEAPNLRLEPSNLRAACAKHNQGRVQTRLAAMAKINRSTAELRPW